MYPFVFMDAIHYNVRDNGIDIKHKGVWVGIPRWAGIKISHYKLFYLYNCPISLTLSFIFSLKLSGDIIFTLFPKMEIHPKNVSETITLVIIQKQFSVCHIWLFLPKRSITTFINELSNCNFTFLPYQKHIENFI